MDKRTRTVTPKTVDDYLAALPSDKRAALKRLRRIVKEVAPEATEVISYGMPIFKLRGMLVGYAAFKDHCSLFVMSTNVMDDFKNELKSYDTSRGTIRFTVDGPIAANLVRRMVKARVRENKLGRWKRGYKS